MKLLCVLMSILFLLSSCGDKPEKDPKPKKQTKKQVKSKFKEPYKEPFVDRHIVDLNEDEFSFDGLKKIDAEIPVMEIVANGKWSQTDYNGLTSFIMLDALKLDKTSVKGLDFSFVQKIRTLKTLSFANTDVEASQIKGLEGSRIKVLDLSNTAQLTDACTDSLAKMTLLKKVILTGNPNASSIKSKLSGVEIQE